MSNFPENKFLATSKATNKQNTFIKPTPEGSPVLTLGIYYMGQGRTRSWRVLKGPGGSWRVQEGHRTLQGPYRTLPDPPGPSQTLFYTVGIFTPPVLFWYNRRPCQ